MENNRQVRVNIDVTLVAKFHIAQLNNDREVEHYQKFFAFHGSLSQW